MRALEHRIPPPLVGLMAAGMMWLLAREFAQYRIPAPGATAAAILLAGIGAAIDVAGLAAFRKARTTINPLRPEKATRLVQSGVYRHTRNPMYPGMLVLLLAWSAYLAHPAALAALPLLVLYINRFEIEPEERAMAKLFGAEFDAYRRRVRRWI
ncbi:MAG: isoprenylcysteine carboxylmethyltransferase family protein [Betaproteobacteria bacterium]|nr:isoprenylcysteine carboxylmethyltransferase family protein [Betaproteobacteria bacterium]